MYDRILPNPRQAQLTEYLSKGVKLRSFHDRFYLPIPEWEIHGHWHNLCGKIQSGYTAQALLIVKMRTTISTTPPSPGGKERRCRLHGEKVDVLQSHWTSVC
jgi:hypothetical protein